MARRRRGLAATSPVPPFSPFSLSSLTSPHSPAPSLSLSLVESAARRGLTPVAQEAGQARRRERPAGGRPCAGSAGGAPPPSVLSLRVSPGGAGVAPDRRLSGGHAGKVAAGRRARAAAAPAGDGRARSSSRGLLLPLLYWGRNPIMGLGTGSNPNPTRLHPDPTR